MNQKCNDKNCPTHGSLRCHGSTFTGTIISTKMQRTCIIELVWRHFIPKYERYEQKRTKIKAHNPPCVDAKDGDIVKVMECRPLSKTKNFVVIEKLGKEKGFKERMEALEDSKVEAPKKEETEEKKEENAST